MRGGALIRSIHDHQLSGIVMELGPHHRYRDDHSNRVVKVLWRDGETTCEFVRMLEVLREGRCSYFFQADQLWQRRLV